MGTCCMYVCICAYNIATQHNKQKIQLKLIRLIKCHHIRRQIENKCSQQLKYYYYDLMMYDNELKKNCHVCLTPLFSPKLTNTHIKILRPIVCLTASPEAIQPEMAATEHLHFAGLSIERQRERGRAYIQCMHMQQGGGPTKRMTGNSDFIYKATTTLF